MCRSLHKLFDTILSVISEGVTIKKEDKIYILIFPGISRLRVTRLSYNVYLLVLSIINENSKKIEVCINLPLLFDESVISYSLSISTIL